MNTVGIPFVLPVRSPPYLIHVFITPQYKGIRSAFKNEILLRGLKDKKHYNGRKKDLSRKMRTHFRAVEDPKLLF